MTGPCYEAHKYMHCILKWL